MTCVLWRVYLLQAFWPSTLADVIHACQGAVLFPLCENMCFVFLLFLLGVSLLNVFLSKRARSLWERALNVRVAQHAYKVSRKHFKTGGSCNIPVQGILITAVQKRSMAGHWQVGVVTLGKWQQCLDDDSTRKTCAALWLFQGSFQIMLQKSHIIKLGWDSYLSWIM